MLLEHKTQDKIAINNQKRYKKVKTEAKEPFIWNARCAASIIASWNPLH